MHNDPELIRSIRVFNRYYTNLLGLHDRTVHHSSFSQVENRVLIEIAQAGSISASGLKQILKVDAGHLSRVIGQLEKQKLVVRERDESDGRLQTIRLTERGVMARQMLDERADNEIRGLIDRLSDDDQRAIVGALETVRGLLSSGGAAGSSFYIRPPYPGDFGNLLRLFALGYAELPGWAERAEPEAAARIAELLAAGDERAGSAWVAERAGRVVGAMLGSQRDGIAEIAFLAVEHGSRGLGIGAALLDVGVTHARRRGAAEIGIWVDAGVASSGLLERAGLAPTERLLLPQAEGNPGTRRRWELGFDRVTRSSADTAGTEALR